MGVLGVRVDSMVLQMWYGGVVDVDGLLKWVVVVQCVGGKLVLVVVVVVYVVVFDFFFVGFVYFNDFYIEVQIFVGYWVVQVDVDYVYVDFLYGDCVWVEVGLQYDLLVWYQVGGIEVFFGYVLVQVVMVFVVGIGCFYVDGEGCVGFFVYYGVFQVWDDVVVVDQDCQWIMIFGVFDWFLVEF